MFASKFTFERHICSISSSFAQKIGLFRKSFRVVGDQNVRMRCFSFFYPSLFGFLLPVLFSAVDFHLKFLIRITELVSFYFLTLPLVCSSVILLGHCVCFTRYFIIFCILTILSSQLVLSQESHKRFFEC